MQKRHCSHERLYFCLGASVRSSEYSSILIPKVKIANSFTFTYLRTSINRIVDHPVVWMRLVYMNQQQLYGFLRQGLTYIFNVEYGEIVSS